ncbi:hypothetical protein ACFC06_13230 [Nocardia sp. NPDC056064]|uniref:hypothetical protein n=1 Tax=Nocardia sp. NPDC056064 TaxID=3345701 RepID=UPI0035DA31BE
MSEQLTASLTAMNAAATHWQLAAGHFRDASALTAKLEISVVNAGNFRKALERYESVPGYFRDRFNEGAAVFEDIATTLNYARRAYEDQQVVSQGKLRQLEGEMNDVS